MPEESRWSQRHGHSWALSPIGSLSFPVCRIYGEPTCFCRCSIASTNVNNAWIVGIWNDPYHFGSTLQSVTTTKNTESTQYKSNTQEKYNST